MVVGHITRHNQEESEGKIYEDLYGKKRFAIVWMIGIFTFSLLLRLVFAFSLPPRAIWPDETGYYNIAINIRNGQGYTNEMIVKPLHKFYATNRHNAKNAFHFAPGLPIMLAGIFYVAGDNVFLVRVIQCLIASSLPILLFWLSVLLFESHRVGLISAIIAAGYPYFIYLSSMFLPQGMFTILLVLALCFFVSWLREGGMGRISLTALVHALGSLFVVPMIFTIIPIGSIMLYRLARRKVTILVPVWFFLCWGMVLGPYLLYVSKKNDTFTLITKGGAGFHVWNHPGLSSMDVLSHTYRPGSGLKTMGQSSETRSNILVDHPLEFMRNCFLRLVAFFSPITFTMTTNIHSGLLANLVGIFIYFPIFLLSIGGLIRMLYQKRRIGVQVALLYPFFLIPHILIVANTRYRIPWDSVIICFAAYYVLDRKPRMLDRLFLKVMRIFKLSV